ncbi:hypothetical protein ACIBBB_03425 [Streptomyces sp. NPDC051217]|uniref:hypothetical protein n=1 Tax=Streptomyces sp. NPDC051217 TaxID=3365644 RepID=UPI0037BA0C53
MSVPSPPPSPSAGSGGPNGTTPPTPGGSRETSWLARFALVVSGLALLSIYPLYVEFWQGQDARSDEEKQENGAPVEISMHPSSINAVWFASDEALGALDGKQFDSFTDDQSVPGWTWLSKHWIPLGSVSTAVNVEALHNTTSLVQGVRLRDVVCGPAVTGSLLKPPGIGNAGTEAPPVVMAMNVDAERPVTRELTEDGRPGDPFTGDVAMEKGDARTFVVSFSAQRKSCTFRADLLVYSNGKPRLVPLPSSSANEGKSMTYDFKVTAPSAAYGGRYVTDVDGMTAVPAEDIDWSGGGPEYTGD